MDKRIVKTINKERKVIYYGFMNMKCSNCIWYSFEEALLDKIIKKYQGFDATYFLDKICRMLEIPMVEEPKVI
jgi:hypothetical protein